MALTKIKTGGIADNAITNAKIADDAIDSPDLADGSIDNVHLAGSIAVSKTLLSAGAGLTLSTNSLSVDADQSGQITQVGTLTSLTGGTGDFNWDSNTLVVDSSASKVGIGTASPARDVVIHGTSNATMQLTTDDTGEAAGDGTIFQQGGTNGVNCYIYNQEAGSIIWGTSDTERMRITSAGKVVIGTTDTMGTYGAGRPVLTLKATADGSLNQYSTLQLGGATINNDGILGTIDFYDGATQNALVRASRASSTTTADIEFFTSPGSGLYERMRIHSNGEVYMGTANEGLSISGLTGGAGTITGINHALSAYKKLVFNATDFSFKISGTEKMRLMSAGELAIPSQPAFCVHPSLSQNSIPNDSTTTVVFGTERFDQGGNFSSNTFTAPATGKYQLNVVIAWNQLDTAASFYRVDITTSNDVYYNFLAPEFSGDTPDSYYWTMAHSVLADMDTNDTAVVHVRTSDGDASSDINHDSYFSGFLACQVKQPMRNNINKQEI